jgi:hypothetical protein
MLAFAPFNHLGDSAGLHEGANRPDAFGYASLLQELLMTLVGFTGDVFLETGARCVGAGSPSGFCFQMEKQVTPFIVHLCCHSTQA